MKAMIFAAGLGSRLKPFTDHHPKALAKVNNVPLLERNIRYLQSYGVNHFVINVHHFASQITDFLSEKDNFGSNIEISDETDEVLETGGGLVKAKELLLTSQDDFFFIMNADILSNLNLNLMVEKHLHQKNEVTLAVSDRSSSRKLLVDNKDRLSGWINQLTQEKKAISPTENYRQFAFSGIHIMNKTYLEQIITKGKFSIMTEYLEKMNDHLIGTYLHQADIVDVGKPESIAIAETIFD